MSALIHLVGWGTSLLIRQPVGINRKAEGGALDAVLGLRLVELFPTSPLLLLLPLLPLLPPVASLFGTFWAELRRPRGGLRGGPPSAAVLSALRGCCRGNLPANRSTNTVVMETQCLSQRLSRTGGESLAAESSMKSQMSLRHLLKMDACIFSCKPKHVWIPVDCVDVALGNRLSKKHCQKYPIRGTDALFHIRLFVLSTWLL